MFEFLKKLFGFNKSAPLSEAVAPIIKDIEDKFADKIEELVVPARERVIEKVVEAVDAVETAVPALEPVIQEVAKKVRKPRKPKTPK